MTEGFFNWGWAQGHWIKDGRIVHLSIFTTLETQIIFAGPANNSWQSIQLAQPWQSQQEAFRKVRPLNIGLGLTVHTIALPGSFKTGHTVVPPAIFIRPVNGMHSLHMIKVGKLPLVKDSGRYPVTSIR